LLKTDCEIYAENGNTAEHQSLRGIFASGAPGVEARGKQMRRRMKSRLSLPHLSLPFSRMNLNFRFSEDDDIFLHERGIPLSMVFLGKNSTV
jgi:hypothetical protein